MLSSGRARRPRISPRAAAATAESRTSLSVGFATNVILCLCQGVGAIIPRGARESAGRLSFGVRSVSFARDVLGRVRVTTARDHGVLEVVLKRGRQSVNFRLLAARYELPQ